MRCLIEKYHRLQMRNDRGEYLQPKVPYIDHLIGVKSILSSALCKFGECEDAILKEDMYNAALGHDLLEDTGITEDEIVLTTNSRVLAFIKELTNPRDDDHTDQYMQQLSCASEEARLIKYADLIENTSSVCYNFHIVDKKWVWEFYRPIMYRTLKVLEKAEFVKYPQTAEFMRSVLAVYADLLNEKYWSNPQQYPVKSVQSMREAIPEQELNEHIKKNIASFRRINKCFSSGYMTPDERSRRFQSEFYDGFYDYIKSKRLSLHFTGKSWSRFLEDYSLRTENEQPVSQIGEPWLRYNDYSEASVLDKLSFFKLMDAYLIPTEYFKPFPEKCIKPKRRYAGDPVYIIKFHLANDGGLFAEKNVIGKTFVLTDENGLKAELKIIRESNRHHETFTAQYFGYGTIEGFTSARKRDIYISSVIDNDIWFCTTIDDDDLDAFNNFPLWAEYRKLTNEFSKLQHEHLKKLMDHFKDL